MSAVTTIAMESVLIPVIALYPLAPVSLVIAVAITIAVPVISGIGLIVISIAFVGLCVWAACVSGVTPALLFGEGAAGNSNHQGCCS